jgi:hypothetical protein
MGHTGAAIADGQAPDQATNSHWAGAGNHKRTSPAKDTKSVSIRVTLAVTGLQPSSNHQTADWILTVSFGTRRCHAGKSATWCGQICMAEDRLNSR